MPYEPHTVGFDVNLSRTRVSFEMLSCVDRAWNRNEFSSHVHQHFQTNEFASRNLGISQIRATADRFYVYCKEQTARGTEKQLA